MPNIHRIKIHTTVARYFTTLARLAGDEANATGESADAAAKSIKQLPLTGMISTWMPTPRFSI